LALILIQAVQGLSKILVREIHKHTIHYKNLDILLDYEVHGRILFLEKNKDIHILNNQKYFLSFQYCPL